MEALARPAGAHSTRSAARTRHTQRPPTLPRRVRLSTRENWTTCPRSVAPPHFGPQAARSLAWSVRICKRARFAASVRACVRAHVCMRARARRSRSVPRCACGRAHAAARAVPVGFSGLRTQPGLGHPQCGQVVDEWDDLLLVPCFLAAPRAFLTELGNTPAFKPAPSDRKKLLKASEQPDPSRASGLLDGERSVGRRPVPVPVQMWQG